jgi:hypothetical protein
MCVAFGEQYIRGVWLQLLGECWIRHPLWGAKQATEEHIRS